MIKKTINLFLLIVTILILTSCTDNDIAEMNGELKLTQLTDSSVKLEWEKNNDIKGSYIIKRKSISDISYDYIATISADKVEYIDTNLPTNKTYKYLLYGVENGVMSIPLQSTISVNFSEIQELVITQKTLTSCKISWINDIDFPMGYIIERREIFGTKNIENILATIKHKSQYNLEKKHVTKYVEESFEELRNNSDFQEIVNIPITAHSQTFYIDEQILPNKSYEYRIRSYTENNESLVKLQDYNNAIKPVSFINATQINVHTFDLSWNDPVDGETSFKLYRSFDIFPFELIYESNPNEIEFIDNFNTRNIYNNVNYKIVTLFRDESSDYEAIAESNIYTRVINFREVADIEIIPKSVVSVDVRWSDENEGDISYEVIRYLGENFDYSIAVADTIYTDTEVPILSNIRYGIRAVSGANKSDISFSQFYDNRLTAPENLSVKSQGNRQYLLQWQYHGNSEFTGYYVERLFDDGNVLDYEKVAEISNWESLSYIDELSADDNPNESISYRICTYYQGENLIYQSEYSYFTISIRR